MPIEQNDCEMFGLNVVEEEEGNSGCSTPPTPDSPLQFPAARENVKGFDLQSTTPAPLLLTGSVTAIMVSGL
ncbi:Hypothetical protein SMAX5B_000715 [Scophthalmus maximus]|uniref:Uncharacterized protein n=1 Tax=Scophthalmus maximus TaxID=52904 RepID=A0A2U9B602_SCOMX|nr:Hypothetical protein SMAX5B_000715 [Scophthalmus maximus]